jgi:hypothetical protein
MQATQHGWVGETMARLAACLVTAAAAAQTAPVLERVAHAVSVSGADGKPVANAEVTCIAAPDPMPFAAGDALVADVVRGRTDAKGRCDVQLARGRGYVAWSSRGGGATGQPVRCRGTRTELRLLPGDAAVPGRWQVTGVEAWREAGPLRGQWIVAGAAFGTRVEIDAKGNLPGPPSVVAAELHLFARDVWVFAGAAVVGKPIVVPPPATITARTTDGHGEVYGEVDLALLVPGEPALLGPWPRANVARRVPLPRTARDGTAVVQLARTQTHRPDEDVPQLAFVATAPGRTPCASGFGGRQYEAGEYLSVFTAATALGFALPSVGPASGRISGADAGWPGRAVVEVQWTVPERARTRTLFDRLGVDIAADGALRWALPPHGAAVAVWLPPKVLALAANDPFAACAPLPVLLPPSVLQAGCAVEDVLPLRLQVVDGSGAPVAGATVCCAPRAGAVFVDPRHAVQAEADAAGRVLVPALRGTWFVAATSDDTFAHAVVDVRPGGEVCTLRLAALSRMPVRVVDGGGRAVAGATVRARVSAWGEAATPERHALQHLGVHLVYAGLQSLTTGADGRLAVPFFADTPATMTLEARRDSKRSEPVALAAVGEPVDLVLR